MSKKVAIIGAGLGGLSTALLLKKQGFRVTIFEKNEQLGGKINNLFIDGFRFDTGASLVTMPFVVEKLFKSLNEDISNFIKINKLDIITKYFFPDGTIINAYSDLNKFAYEISTKTKQNPKSIQRYFDYSKQIYDLTADLFIFNDFSSIRKLFNLKGLKTLINITKIDPFRTIHQANSSFFQDERILQLFDRYATYNGSNPYQAPATLNIIPYVEYFLGGYYFQEGMYSLIESLSNLCKKNDVQIETNEFVLNLEVLSNKIIKLHTDKGSYDFDYYISNSDVNYTFKNLLKDNSSTEARRNAQNPPSSSALVFYWGVKGTHPMLDTHNILFSKDYHKEFSQIFDFKQVPEDPTIYIYISSKFKPSDAPADCENWFVMINTPEHIGQDWNKIISLQRKLIINKIRTLTGIDLHNKIITERVLTPQIIEQNSLSYFGSIYGISSNNRKAAFLRQKNKSKKYKNLFFVGGSVHPGGGIPLVISSALIVSKMLEEIDDRSKA